MAKLKLKYINNISKLKIKNIQIHKTVTLPNCTIKIYGAIITLVSPLFKLKILILKTDKAQLEPLESKSRTL